MSHIRNERERLFSRKFSLKLPNIFEHFNGCSRFLKIFESHVMYECLIISRNSTCSRLWGQTDGHTYKATVKTLCKKPTCIKLTYVCVNCGEKLKTLPILVGILTRLQATRYKNVGHFLHDKHKFLPHTAFCPVWGPLNLLSVGNMNTPRGWSSLNVKVTTQISWND